MLFMEKSTISIAIFHSFLLVHQRVTVTCFRKKKHGGLHPSRNCWLHRVCQPTELRRDEIGLQSIHNDVSPRTTACDDNGPQRSTHGATNFWPTSNRIHQKHMGNKHWSFDEFHVLNSMMISNHFLTFNFHRKYDEVEGIIDHQFVSYEPKMQKTEVCDLKRMCPKLCCSAVAFPRWDVSFCVQVVFIENLKEKTSQIPSGKLT